VVKIETEIVFLYLTLVAVCSLEHIL